MVGAFHFPKKSRPLGNLKISYAWKETGESDIQVFFISAKALDNYFLMSVDQQWC